MRGFGKKVAATAIAAAFLIGGSSFFGTAQASAAEFQPKPAAVQPADQPIQPNKEEKPSIPMPEFLSDHSDKLPSNWLQEAARVLGMSEQQLMEALHNGHTWNNLIQERGFRIADFHLKLVDALHHPEWYQQAQLPAAKESVKEPAKESAKEPVKEAPKQEASQQPAQPQPTSNPDHQDNERRG